MLYTITSKKDFSTVITDVKQALSEIKFGVLWEMDIPSKLKEKGVDYEGQYRVLEVCKPQEAKKALILCKCEEKGHVLFLLSTQIVAQYTI